MWFGFFGFFRRWLLKKRESRRTGVARPSPISDRSQFKPEQIGESMKARAASQRTDWPRQTYVWGFPELGAGV